MHEKHLLKSTFPNYLYLSLSHQDQQLHFSPKPLKKRPLADNRQPQTTEIETCQGLVVLSVIQSVTHSVPLADSVTDFQLLLFHHRGIGLCSRRLPCELGWGPAAGWLPGVLAREWREGGAKLVVMLTVF